MEQITRSRAALAFLVSAALVFVLGTAFQVAAFASLTPANLALSGDLARAGDWLRFAGAVIAIIGICAAGWELVLGKSWVDAAEAGAVALGALLLAIGLLVRAASSQASSPAHIVAAVGVGCWSLLVLIRAARRSLGEEQARAAGASVPHQAVLWLVSAGGLLLFAVGSGFALDVASSATGIASGVLEAAGAALVLGTAAAARAQGFLSSRAMPAVLAGLALLTATGIAVALVSGIALGPDATLTGLRVGISVSVTVELLAVAALGIAAWLRLGEQVVSGTQARAPGRTSRSIPP
ncbi:MAG TPA: hypothetical protein VF834_23170 [Streptosporangiaceae bacterium]